MKIKVIGQNNASCLIKSKYTTLIDIERDLFKFVSTEELKNIDNIILTHGHIHAIEGIPKLATFLNWHGKGVVNLYASYDIIKLIKLRYDDYADAFNFIEIQTPRKIYKVGDLEVKPVKVNHDPHYPTYAYRINKCVFWGPSMAPDWSQYDLRYMSNNILACFDGREWNEDSDRHLSMVYDFSQISKLNNKHTLFVGTKPVDEQANQMLQTSLDSYKKKHPTAYNQNISISKAVENFSINMDKLKEKTGEGKEKAKADAPNYKKATGTRKCSTCHHYSNGRCNKYNFAAGKSMVCDGWKAKEKTVEDKTEGGGKMKSSKQVVDRKDIKMYMKKFQKGQRTSYSVIDGFLGVASYRQKVMVRGFGYYKLALISKALQEFIKDEWNLKETIDLDYSGQRARPTYAYLETGVDEKEELLICGYMFLQHKEFGHNLVLAIYPRMWDFAVELFYRENYSESAVTFYKKLDEWVLENNIFKGKSVTPEGHFLPESDMTFDDVKLPVDQKQAIKVGALEFFTKKDIYAKNKIPFKRGLIFAGEPGTGKTLTGKILMSKAESTFIWVTSEMLKWPEDVKYIFRMTRELSPCILFAEDIDDYLKKAQSIDTLKTQMDGLESSEGIVTILCTNYPERIPLSLIDRPSRFDDVIKFEAPDAQLRFEILSMHFTEIELEDKEIVLRKIAEEAKGLTGSHLKEVAIYSILLASDAGRDKIIKEDVVQALRKVQKTREVIATLSQKKDPEGDLKEEDIKCKVEREKVSIIKDLSIKEVIARMLKKTRSGRK